MGNKKYEINIEFIELKTVEIEADSEIAAKEIVYEKIQNGDIDDFVSGESHLDFYEKILSVEEVEEPKGYERVQMQLGNRLFAVDVKKNQSYAEKIKEAHFEITKQIGLNNEFIANIFFEELRPVCSKCGISLTNGEESEDLMCLQCQKE